MATSDDTKWRWRLVIEVAAEWFIRSLDDQLSETERGDYSRWLRMSPMHIAETFHLYRMRRGFAAALRGMTAEMFTAERDSPSNVFELTPDALPSSRAQLIQESEQSHPLQWKVAAGIATFAVTSLLALGIKVACFDRTIETGAGDWRQLTLTDGTAVRVDPHTRLRFEFGDSRRLVYLQRGAAYFRVTKDAARPFVVTAEPLSVRAVGTAFGVMRHGKRIVVTVDEGVVAVTGNGGGKVDDREGEQHVAVTAGEQVEVSDSRLTAARRVDVEKELAWARGKLVFSSGDTLARAANEFNRRNRVQIAIDDPVLKVLPVRGSFHANDPESFAASVATAAHAEIVRDRAGVLRIVRAGNGD